MQRLVVGLWLAPNFLIQPSAAMAANMQLAVHQCDRLPLYRRLPSAPPPSTVVRSPLLFSFRVFLMWFLWTSTPKGHFIKLHELFTVSGMVLVQAKRTVVPVDACICK